MLTVDRSRYTTFAGLAGASVESTGPLPVDGINIWNALKANETNATRHMLIQVRQTLGWPRSWANFSFP
jgi:hypothetical protein